MAEIISGRPPKELYTSKSSIFDPRNPDSSLRLDPATGSIQNLDYEHHEIHAGSHYTCVEGVSIGNGATRTYILTTPDTTEWIHFILDLSFSGASFATFTEGVSTDADGTEVACFNNDRNSANTAGLVITHTPTNPTGGDVVATSYGGTGRNIGGSFRNAQEFILKQNTKYQLDLRNDIAGSANLVDVGFRWYEHTNIN